MTETKNASKSVTVIAGVGTVIFSIAGLLGVHVADELQAEILQNVTMVATAIGGLIAIWGRIKATTKIGD